MPFPVPFLYPYDPTGTQASNKITAEHHVVTPPVNNAKANFIVPTASPFFGDSMVVRTGPLPTDPLLVRGVDYDLVLQFIEASNVLYTQIYGAIVFNDHGFNQDVYLTYQTMGGPYVANDYTFVENFDQSLYHIRLVSWTQIVGLTSGFPPLPHPTPAPDLTGMAELVAKIEQLITVITANGSVAGLSSALTNHLSTLSGAHAPSAVGLGNLPNYGVATLSELLAWANNKLVVPSLLQGLLLPQNPTAGKILVGDGAGFVLSDLENAQPRSNAFMYMSTLIDLKLWVRKPGLKIEGVMRFGDAALNIASLGLGTTWLVYAFWTGTAIQLEVSTTDYATSPTDPDVFIKIGDPTRTLVGMIFKNDDSMWHTRSVYVDNRQYTALLTDPYTHPEWIKPYEGKKLPADYPYWTGTSSEWSDPTSVSNVTDMEIPVLMFANEIVRVRYNANMNYSTLGEGSPAQGTFDIVTQLTTPTVPRSSSPEVIGARHTLNHPYGSSEDTVYYTEASGVVELYGANNSRVCYVTMRAAKSVDPDAAGNMSNWNSIFAYYAPSSYTWLYHSLGFKRNNGVFGSPLISSKEHTYLAIEHDVESFNLRAFANHL